MNRGVFGYPVGSRIRTYESDPTTITAGTAQTFRHGFGRLPKSWSVWLRCAVANNGYVEGDEIPINLVVLNSGIGEDGQPRWSVRASTEEITVFIASSNIRIITTTASSVVFTASQWKLVVRADDLYPNP